MASDFFGGRSEDSVEEYTYSEAFALAEEVIENWDDYANAIVVAASNYYTKYEGSPPRIKETDLENPYNFQIELNFVEALRVTSVKFKADVADSYGKYESCEDTGGSSNCWQLDYYTDVPPTPYVLVANEGYYRIKYVISEYNDLSDDLEDYGTSFLNAYLGVSQQEGNYILTDDTADEIPGDIDSNYSSFGNVFYSFLQYQYSATAGEQFNLEQGTVEDNTGENVSPGPSL